MRDVEVRDFVPSLLTVTDRFGTIKPRIIKKMAGGNCAGMEAGLSKAV
jgi:hypothetical protein